MTHVVTESCIRCKYTDCVDVCPVDCFREGPNMLVIDPDECIDCAVCIPECPVNAIYAEEDLPADQMAFIKLNVELAMRRAGRASPSASRRSPMPKTGKTRPTRSASWCVKHRLAASGESIMEPQLNQEVINTAQAHDGPIETDAVIVGAGPVGLFQVFELGLLEIKAHVIDSLAHPGGQCVELYPDKPIYDIPAVPVCTGQELTDSLLKQIEPFGATFHFGQEVTVVEKQDDGRFYVETSRGTRFLTKTIFIAAGVGAFQPRAAEGRRPGPVSTSRNCTTASRTRPISRARTW